jgi:rhodanese-related sulfurtransferase
VRQADAFEAGHLPGSRNAPGGQLVQATDTFMAVRNARVVLVDEHQVQSVIAAHWLKRMGWDVFVVSDAAGNFSEKGPARSEALVAPRSDVRMVDASELKILMDGGKCVVVDVGESYWYRQGRIPGSYYSMRSALGTTLGRFDMGVHVVFCCSQGSVAPYAAGEARDLGFTTVSALRGGRNEWRRCGFPLELVGDGDDELIISPTDDMWYPPWARKEGVAEAMMQYLTWEVGLLETMKSETYITFSVT